MKSHERKLQIPLRNAIRLRFVLSWARGAVKTRANAKLGFRERGLWQACQGKKVHLYQCTLQPYQQNRRFLGPLLAGAIVKRLKGCQSALHPNGDYSLGALPRRAFGLAPPGYRQKARTGCWWHRRQHHRYCVQRDAMTAKERDTAAHTGGFFFLGHPQVCCRHP